MLSITTIDNEVIDVTDWVSIKEPILRVSFQINEKRAIVLEGFESYLRVKEMVKGVNCKIDGISKIFMFGRADGLSYTVEINFKTGEIKNYFVPIGEEYNGRLSAEKEWKKGIKGQPKIYVKNTEPGL